MRLPGLLKRAVIEQNTERGGLVETFVALATRARRDGLLSLESEADKMTDPFLRRGVQLVVDGTDETVIRQVLEADVAATKERHQVGYSIFDTMGGFSPTLGIMGAVLGLIHVLSKVDDPTKLAAGIATAFVATLYGVGTANLIFFPMANKLRLLSEEESNLRGLMIRGILSINAGDNPRVVRQKLEAYLPPKSREAAVAKAESPQEAPALAASARR
jgi:chemotaxis protein MotA